MKSFWLISICILLAGCGGLAWNTTVADTPSVRRAMAESVVLGKTTEGEFTARWGLPTQKIREGGQTSFVYRNLSDFPYEDPFIKFGDSTRYVIVTFQYGIASAVVTSDGVNCRATFPPRPPGHGFDNPAVVSPIGTCPGVYRPPSGQDQGMGGPV